MVTEPRFLVVEDDPVDAKMIHRLLDMGGNVFEWTLDAFVPYSAGDKGDNTKADAPRRVVRGGSFFTETDDLRSSARSSAWPSFQAHRMIGFRLARDP